MASEAVRRTVDGFSFRFDPGAVWLLDRLVPHLDDLSRQRDVSVVKRNNVRTVLRVPLPEGVVYLKRYHVRGPLEWLKYLVVPSRATAEWRAARAMSAAGLPTIDALMMGEKRRGGVLLDGCLASAEIPGGEDFVPYLHLHFGTDEAGRSREEEHAKREHLVRLARLIRRFHDLGFRHEDLHGGNILVTGPPESSTFHLLDLHSVKASRRVGRRARIRNLAKLLHSLTSAMRAPDRLRFLLAYEGDRPVLGDGRRVLPEVLERIRRLEARRLVSRTKRCLRHSSGFVPGHREGFRFFVRREIDPASALVSIGEHLGSVARGGRNVLKDSRRSALTRERLAGPSGAARIVVKQTRCRGAMDRVKNAFRRPRALASWVNGNGLVVRQVGVARPLAVFVAGPAPFCGDSFLLMEDISELERLDLFVLRRYAGVLDASRRAEKRRLASELGRFVGALHARGIYHGDLKAVNVFVDRPDEGGFGFRLVDYDRVRFGKRVNRRRRTKNLAQLAASIAVLATKTDRLRFFRAYVPDEDALRHEKAYNRAVQVEVAQKIVVHMEPIE